MDELNETIAKQELEIKRLNLHAATCEAFAAESEASKIRMMNILQAYKDSIKKR